jgi:hypothetical protein
MPANFKSTGRILGRAAERASTSSAHIQEKIRRRAYQLYLEGGCREGHERDDWLRAEREILGTAQRTGARENIGVSEHVADVPKQKHFPDAAGENPARD